MPSEETRSVVKWINFMIRTASHYSIVMSGQVYQHKWNIGILWWFSNMLINFHYDDEYADDGFVLVLHFGIMYIDHWRWSVGSHKKDIKTEILLKIMISVTIIAASTMWSPLPWRHRRDRCSAQIGRGLIFPKLNWKITWYLYTFDWGPRIGQVV